MPRTRTNDKLERTDSQSILLLLSVDPSAIRSRLIALLTLSMTPPKPNFLPTLGDLEVVLWSATIAFVGPVLPLAGKGVGTDSASSDISSRGEYSRGVARVVGRSSVAIFVVVFFGGICVEIYESRASTSQLSGLCECFVRDFPDHWKGILQLMDSRKFVQVDGWLRLLLDSRESGDAAATESDDRIDRIRVKKGCLYRAVRRCSYDLAITTGLRSNK